jgi:hypothetical protein
MSEQKLHTLVRILAQIDIGYGEELLVCGSAVSLGSWDLSKAAAMKWQENGLWVVDVQLPCGVRVELKLVVRPQGAAVRWLGCGSSGENNILLETSLGRAGAQPSRFVAVDDGLRGLPFKLIAEDVAEEKVEVDQVNCDSSALVPAGDRGCLRSIPTPCRSMQRPPTPCRPPPMTPMVPQQSAEALAALMLAGQAGAAGHAVTYTTTTTTTTSVTINGASSGMPAQCNPPGPAITYAPTVTQETPPCGRNGNQEALGSGSAPNEPTKQEVAGRKYNADVPRAGPAPFIWSKSAQDVKIRGSWDSWKRDLSLEPSPTGDFRAMLILPPGEYQFKFIVDGVWTTSDEMECTKCNDRNNIISVNEMVLVPMPIGPFQDAPSDPEEFTQLAVR